MARVFVAAWPPPAVAEHLATLPGLPGLPGLDAPGLHRVPAGNLHATLRFLGDVSAAAVTDRLGDADLDATTARLGPVTSLLGPRLVIAPVAGLDDLAAAVGAATAGLGQPPRHPFRGHVTLARTRDAAAARSATGVPCTARFAVTEVAVVTSETHPTGARYTTVATVACRPVRPHR